MNEFIPPALTVAQVKKYYNISRYALKKLEEKGKIKSHRPNMKSYLYLKEDIENAIRVS